MGRRSRSRRCRRCREAAEIWEFRGPGYGEDVTASGGDRAEMRYPGRVAPPRRERPPAERSVTIREALLRRLREGPCNAHQLSRLVGIPEKHVADHLGHVARSLRPTGGASPRGPGSVSRLRLRLQEAGPTRPAFGLPDLPVPTPRATPLRRASGLSRGTPR